MWVLALLCGSIVLLVVVLINLNRNFWEKYGVRQFQHANLFEKFLVTIGRKPLADLDDAAYTEMEKRGIKFIGTVELQQPILLVKDLDIIKNIMIKDFDHFVDRRPFTSGGSQKIVNKMVGNLQGEEWKGVRAAVSPIFTTGKIRRMMECFSSVSYDWIEYLKENAVKSGSDSLTIEVHKETTHYATDVLASAVFGINGGTVRNSGSYFSKMVHRMGDFTTLHVIKIMLSNRFPKVWEILGIPIFDQQALDFFTSLFSDGMKVRKNGGIKSNDFISLLAEAQTGKVKSTGTDDLNQFEKDAQLIFRNDPGKKNYLSDEITATAQAVQFFFAGFTTVSNYIAFVIYMLALNQDVQEKLREELNSELFCNGDEKNVDYDKLNKLPYLDMVLCEVLRKFPPLDRLERKCVKDYHDNSENLHVPKDVVVCIPLRSIHNDKKYYDYPDKFYPEHFSVESKEKRNNVLSFLSFGNGPRGCLGRRFALVESKCAIAHLVHNFIIEATSKTPNPVKVKPLGPGVLVPDGLEVKLRLANISSR